MTVSEQNIPLLDLKSQYEAIRDEIDAALKRVVEAQYFILGPEVAAFEEEIAGYLQGAHCVGVSSGSDALLLALMVLGIKPGDEVITSSYTFFATAGAISRLGAKPVFIDIDPYTYNIDPGQIRSRITKQTRVVIPVHLYGQVAEMQPIMNIAKEHDLFVVEDAAQAIGAEYMGIRAGLFGDIGCLSFFPSKNLGAFGDGGMVTTQDNYLNDRLRLFRNHGYNPKYYNAVVGGNFRLDAIQAAVLRVKLKYLDSWTANRQLHAQLYRKLFSEADLSIDLDSFYGGQLGVVLPQEAPQRRHVYNQFVIRCHQRDQLMRFLKEKGISTEVYYPLPLHLQECFEDLGYRPGDLPMSEAASNQTLALPIYPELTESMISDVVETIAKFYKQNNQQPYV